MLPAPPSSPTSNPCMPAAPRSRPAGTPAQCASSVCPRGVGWCWPERAHGTPLGATDPVEHLTVGQAAGRIKGIEHRASVVVLYWTTADTRRETLAGLARLATFCRAQGIELLAFNTDRDPAVVARLPALLAGFEPAIPPARLSLEARDARRHVRDARDQDRYDLAVAAGRGARCEWARDLASAGCARLGRGDRRGESRDAIGPPGSEWGTGITLMSSYCRTESCRAITGATPAKSSPSPRTSS